MSKENLPLYQIPDFFQESLDSSSFYYSRLARHLKTHKFIQKPHKHGFFILLLFTVGSGTHSIDFRNYRVSPGSFFFLAPGQVHSWQLSEDCDGHILFFSTQFYGLGFPTKSLSGFPFFGAGSRSPHLELESGQTAEAELLFSEIEREAEAPGWSKKEILRAYTEILLIKMARIFHDTYGSESASPMAEDRFKLLEATVETHFRSARKASFYSDQLHLSLKQLNRLTKTSVGKTISELLLDRVILESQRLLTYSGDSVAEIAAQLGFEDPSYFSRLFRKKTGSTPEQFRRSVQ